MIKLMKIEDVETHAEAISILLSYCFEETYSDRVSEEILLEKMQSLRLHLTQEKAFPIGAFCNDHLVGFLWGYPISSPHGDRFHVAYISVAKENRRKGIASKLMQKAQEVAAKKNISQIELRVGVSNEKALQFYRKIGFRAESTMMIKGA